VSCGGKLPVDIPPRNAPQRPDEFFSADRLAYVQEWLFSLVLYANRAAGFLQSSSICRGDHNHWLTKVKKLAVGQEWFVENDDAEQITPRHIGCRVTSDNARDHHRRARINAHELPGRNRAAHETDEQLTGDRPDIVDVRRLTRYMADRGIVGNRFSKGRHARLLHYAGTAAD
jgi:hypothetical protein